MPAGGRTALIAESGATVLAGDAGPTIAIDPDQTSLPQGALTPGGSAAGRKGMLLPGQAFGSRYRVVRQLGIGGMGAVYQAWDSELGVTVALKTIRPGSDPWVATELEQRFKRELLLAREVTHKNVVRIHDLGEIDRIKYITMSYVDGWSLSALLHARGKLPVPEALGIARQVASGLQAAHEAGVVHRDLKPANIMVDGAGHALILDFGIARLESGIRHEAPGAPPGAGMAAPPGWMTGATISGAVVGTLEYMAPEQAKAGEVDHRADIYAFGLILRDLLVGLRPAADPMEDLRQRVEQGLPPLRDVDGALPEALESIVTACTQTDPLARYQTTQEVCAALGRLDDNGQLLPEPRRLTWRVVAAGVVLAAGLTGGAAWLLRPAPPPKAHDPVSVLVADFDNRTGEAVFDGTLEPMFNVALEEAGFLSAFSRGTARRLAGQLPTPTERLDKAAARLVAVSQNVGAVVTGELTRQQNRYAISAAVVDAVTGHVLARAAVTAANKDEVLRVVPRVVAPLRKALGDTTPESVQLTRTTGAFTAASLEAVHEYGKGMELQFAGKPTEALAAFTRAAELDSSFARAYSGMAAQSFNLGRRQDFEKYIGLALAHVDRMTEREAFRVRSLYYVRIGNLQKCVSEGAEMLKRYPADNVVTSNLAGCYMGLRDFAKAMEAARHAVDLAPSGVLQRVNLAFTSIYAGDFPGAEKAAQAAVRLNPSSEPGFHALAEAQVGQGKLAEAAATYDNLERLSTVGASFAASGRGDLAIYEGRFQEAVRILEQGAGSDLSAKAPEYAAGKLTALACAQLARNQKAAARAAAEKALAVSQAPNTRFLAARILLEAGGGAKPQQLAAELAAEPQPEPRAYGKIIQGALAVGQGDARGGIQLLTDANGLLDTWIGHFELGRAYLAAGQFVEADAEFNSCLKRRGEAMELFFDDVNTYGLLPVVYYYQARAREGLKSAGSADSYRTYLSIREKAGEDPLLADIRRRLGH
jgi:tetratricopeptide (TPR) repeat protein/TolB-like protein